MKTFAIDIHDTHWDDFMPSRVNDSRPVVSGNDILTQARTFHIKYDWTSYVDDGESKFIIKTHRTRNPRGLTRRALRAAILRDYLEFDRKDMMWGHYVDDLYIESVKYDVKTRTFTLNIGS